MAERILERHDNCLVTAAAGGGKTSLLRTVLVASVKRWAAGRRDPVVPVLVPAAVLAGRSLPEAIAKSSMTNWRRTSHRISSVPCPCRESRGWYWSTASTR